MRRNELETKSVLMQERISFHASEGLKLENWHSSRIMAWKAITNGETQLAMAALQDECTNAEMELKAAITASAKCQQKSLIHQSWQQWKLMRQ